MIRDHGSHFSNMPARTSNQRGASKIPPNFAYLAFQAPSRGLWMRRAGSLWHKNITKIFQFYKALDQWEQDLEPPDQWECSTLRLRESRVFPAELLRVCTTLEFRLRLRPALHNRSVLSAHKHQAGGEIRVASLGIIKHLRASSLDLGNCLPPPAHRNRQDIFSNI